MQFHVLDQFYYHSYVKNFGVAFFRATVSNLGKQHTQFCIKPIFI